MEVSLQAPVDWWLSDTSGCGVKKLQQSSLVV